VERKAHCPKKGNARRKPNGASEDEVGKRRKNKGLGISGEL
jgi:hypothetical protein